MEKVASLHGKETMEGIVTLDVPWWCAKSAGTQGDVVPVFEE